MQRYCNIIFQKIIVSFLIFFDTVESLCNRLQNQSIHRYRKTIWTVNMKKGNGIAFWIDSPKEPKLIIEHLKLVNYHQRG